MLQEFVRTRSQSKWQFYRVSRRIYFCANGRPEHDHTLPSILFLEDPLNIHPPATRSIPYVGSN